MTTLRVLTSHREPRATTNPYITMLTSALRRTPGVEVVTFTGRAALLGRYDVVHLHWPETITGLGGRRLAGRVVRWLLAALLLLRLTVTRTPVVRTVHNVGLPADAGPAQRLLLRWFDRLTTHRIVLNDRTECPGPVTTIPHGHYRDWYTGPRSATVPGRFQYVGLVRRYKGVEGLVEAFRAVPDADVSLEVAGAASTPELAATITGLADGDPRVTLRFAFLSDDELVSAITAAELVVLPYRFMHNSGTVLAALSLDRPVLVPDTPVNADLAAEVGPGWIHTFTDDLTADDLTRALDAARAPRAASPDLGAREWDDAGQAHLDVYRAALARTRPAGRTAEVPA
ncbi:glycosyltransferase [Promicromonospora citrea]|uniref:GDP-mannose:glycolipid 4-beta-D-mannosyltransferase n=1 Tax=Promicromonospora citrea TaxID=43677 RepID=A0A8H9GE56_9MICO|nr:glycosyltransferase [Promicromonospora citrea]NNH52291.1 glycosyltransferase [Promicromonospora citrea]GGM13280.1 GDP-mannose:glycolipid 4-beta-D-mannosyltransferase [Promicromonospora citrea]